MYGKEEEFDSEEEDDNLFLIDTATENSRSFAESWKNNNSVEGFLKREDYIPVRATAVKNSVDQEELIHKSDIDGITIDWLNIAKGQKSDFRHFEIMPQGVRSLRRFLSRDKETYKSLLFQGKQFHVA